MPEIKVIQSSQLLSFSPSESMATLKNKRMLAAVWKETQEITGNSQSQNISVPGFTEEYIMQVLRRLRAESLKNCPRIWAFWELCPNWMNFSWTHWYGRSPESFWECPGKITKKIENQLGIVPRVRPIPKWTSLPSHQQFSWLRPGRDLSHSLTLLSQYALNICSEFAISLVNSCQFW